MVAIGSPSSVGTGGVAPLKGGVPMDNYKAYKMALIQIFLGWLTCFVGGVDVLYGRITTQGAYLALWVGGLAMLSGVISFVAVVALSVSLSKAHEDDENRQYR